jgi:hypothetical protein
VGSTSWPRIVARASREWQNFTPWEKTSNALKHAPHRALSRRHARLRSHPRGYQRGMANQNKSLMPAPPRAPRRLPWPCASASSRARTRWAGRASSSRGP